MGSGPGYVLCGVSFVILRTYSKANATRRIGRNWKADEELSTEQINRFCEGAGEEREAGRGTRKRVLQKTPTL